jgi:predicted ABC-type transport system involved in lysophospholipase L1 biosynthesis ATPase subunit
LSLLAPLGTVRIGKSMLLQIVGGLDVPSEGALQVGEHRLDGAGEAALTAYHIRQYNKDPKPLKRKYDDPSRRHRHFF